MRFIYAFIKIIAHGQKIQISFINFQHSLSTSAHWLTIDEIPFEWILTSRKWVSMWEGERKKDLCEHWKSVSGVNWPVFGGDTESKNNNNSTYGCITYPIKCGVDWWMTIVKSFCLCAYTIMFNKWTRERRRRRRRKKGRPKDINQMYRFKCGSVLKKVRLPRRFCFLRARTLSLSLTHSLDAVAVRYIHNQQMALQGFSFDYFQRKQK
jgi:hypothetical protein